MNECPPITVTAGGLVLGLKRGESVRQADHIGCIDAPVFIAAGRVGTLSNKDFFFPVAVCRDLSNDFPQALESSGGAA